MAYKSLHANRLPFDLVRSEDIRAGMLTEYSLLFVPGGWASNKLKALGPEGASEIRSFVERGGNYLGFCGGAGLATLDGIGLLDIRRRPTRERVPSFSGRIGLHLGEHPIWSGLTENAGFETNNLSASAFNLRPPAIFHVWWPSQFIVGGNGVNVLATYGEAMPDSFTSDLNVGDVSARFDWQDLEKVYGINLDPKRLLHEPAILEGTYGKGRVLVSLIHFDTPDDYAGSTVLRNLWSYLTDYDYKGLESSPRLLEEKDGGLAGRGRDLMDARVLEYETKIGELISFGLRNFLWFWRNRMLLQWRRGVRGLEYCTLFILLTEMAEIMRSLPSDARHELSSSLRKGLDEIGGKLTSFLEDASKLLIMERLAIQTGTVTYQKCDNPEIRELRLKLFSDSKSHGGAFKELIDAIDGILVLLLKDANASA